MIEVDPASIEGSWRLAHPETPTLGRLLTFRDGRVSDADVEIAAYFIVGAALAFTTSEIDEDGVEWFSAYSFNLFGPLANLAAPGLLDVKIVRADEIPGSVTITEKGSIGEDLEMYEDCVLVRSA